MPAKDFPKASVGVPSNHPSNLGLVIRQVCPGWERGSCELGEGGPGSTEHQKGKDQAWPSGFPTCSPSCCFVLPVPGGDLTISVLWLSIGLHCVGNHCFPPFPQPVGTRLASWPLNQLPCSSGCLDATGDSCAFVAFSGHSPPCCSLALCSPGMGSGLGAPRTGEQP